MKFKSAAISKAFGKVLSRLREKNGQTQGELAQKSKLNRTFISFLERGIRQPSLSTLIRIAGAFNLRPSKIVSKVEDELG